MTKSEYLIDGLLAGNTAKQLIEDMEQAKLDRCRQVAKVTKLPLEQVQQLATLDPTANGSYIDWLARISSKSQLPPADQVSAALARFDKLKRLPAFSGDKNIAAYKSFEQLDSTLLAAHAVSSRTEKDRQIRAFSNYVYKKYPYNDKSGKPLIVGGYPQWIERLVKSGDVILPEDGDSLMELIDLFELKKKDPKFTRSKNIMTYRNRGQLNAALHADAETTSGPVSYEPLAEGDGVKLIDKTFVNGHYYDLYAITAHEAAKVHFAKSNFPPGKNGWCVKDKTYWDNYRMGPKNPAYLFRKDGVPYALTDVGSHSVKDQNDQDATPDLIFELLYLDMPTNVKENILNIDPWTKKYKDAIIQGGPDAAIAQAFEEAANATGTYDEQWKVALDSAIQFMRHFGWAHPPTEAMEFVQRSPVIAMAYAVFVEKERIPSLEPVILKHPRASAAYYDYFNRGTVIRDPRDKEKVLAKVEGGQFPQHKWPELYDKLNFFLSQREHLPFVVYAQYSGQVMPPETQFTFKMPGSDKEESYTWGQIFTSGAPWWSLKDPVELRRKYELAVKTNGDYINEIKPL